MMVGGSGRDSDSAGRGGGEGVLSFALGAGQARRFLGGGTDPSRSGMENGVIYCLWLFIYGYNIPYVHLNLCLRLLLAHLYLRTASPSEGSMPPLVGG